MSNNNEIERAIREILVIGNKSSIGIAVDKIMRLIEPKNMSDENNKFKALMHCGVYVDANRLMDGIYICDKPFIYSSVDTIEMMIDNANLMKDKVGANFFHDNYFDNLKKCELVTIVISKLGEN